MNKPVPFNSQMLPGQTVAFDTIQIEARNNAPAAAVPITNKQPKSYYEVSGKTTDAETEKYTAADIRNFPIMEI